MNPFFGVTVLILLGITALVFLMPKGKKRMLSSADEAFDDLFKQGCDGSVVYISLGHLRHTFLQFRKDVSHNGDGFSATLLFPIAQWSQGFQEGMESVLKHHKLPYKYIRLNIEVLECSCGNDSGMLGALTQSIFTELFNADPDSFVYISLSDGKVTKSV